MTRLFNLNSKLFRDNNNKIIKNDKTNKIVINSFKNSTDMPNIGAIGELIFLTFNAKKLFNHLKQALIKALIL